MSARIFRFSRKGEARDWSTQELAEFYRVEAILVQTGIKVTSDRGRTDEGEPWFVFCRADDEEVVIHFARIDGQYVVSAPTYFGSVDGADFRKLVQELIERHPVFRPRPKADNLLFHPAALLVVLVASALLKSTVDAHAATPAPGHASEPGKDVANGAMRSADSRSEVVGAGGAQEVLLIAAAGAALAAAGHWIHPIEIVSPVSAAPMTSIDVPASTASLPASVEINSPAPVRNVTSVDGASHETSYLAAVSHMPLVVSFAPSWTNVDLHEPHAIGHAGSFSAAAFLLDLAPDSAPASTLPLPLVDPLVGAHHVDVSALADLPQAEIDFLHALNIKGFVAYQSNLPAAFVATLTAGTHTTAHADGSAGTEGAQTSTTASPTPAHADSSAASSVSAATHDTVQSPPTPVPTAALSPSPDIDQASSTTDNHGALPEAPAAAPSSAVESPPAALSLPAVNSDAAAAPGNPAPQASTPSMSDVLAIVENFQKIEAHPAMVMTDHSAIFYDQQAVDIHFSAVTSVTYDFDHTFSISLVGIPAELIQAGAHF